MKRSKSMKEAMIINAARTMGQSGYTAGAPKAPGLGRQEFRNLIKMRKRPDFDRNQVITVPKAVFMDPERCKAKPKAEVVNNRTLWNSGERGTYERKLHGELNEYV